MRKNIKLGLICLSSLLLASCSPINLYFSGSGSDSVQTPPPGQLPDQDPGSSDSSNQENRVTLRLDLAGGSIDGPDSFTVQRGTAVTLPTPTRADHTFDGWYNGEAKQGTSFTVNEDTTLIARWIKPFSTVSFDVVGGDAVDQTVDVRKNEQPTFPITKKKGYTFNGWANNGTLITDATGKVNAPWSFDNDVTLTASFELIEYTINLYFTGEKKYLETKSYNIEKDLFDVLEYSSPNYELVKATFGYYKDHSDGYKTLINSYDVLTEGVTGTVIDVYAKKVIDEFLFNPEESYNGILNEVVNMQEPTFVEELDLRHLFIHGQRIGGIGANAFKGNTTLKTIFIPRTISTIEDGALSSLSSLTDIRVEINNENEVPKGWKDFAKWAGKNVQWGQK